MKTQKADYKILSEKGLPRSAFEYEIEVTGETFDMYRQTRLNKIVSETELPGFRKGKAPEAIVLKHIGEMHLLEEAANDLINEVVYSVLAEKQIRFIGQPSISILTLAKGNPLKFKMQIALVPDFTLPDYKKIASEINAKKNPEAEVSEREMEESMLHIRRIVSGSPEDKNPPELTDETVKRLGKFASVAEFTERLKTDLLSDKKARAKEKRLLEIVEAVVSKTKADIPQTLIEHELDRIEAEFTQDLERMGQKKEDYLKRINKTPEQLRKEWEENAEKRAKFELMLPRIAKQENITVPHEEAEHETKHLLEHYKDADKETAKLYVERALLRQKVIEMFDKQK